MGESAQKLRGILKLNRPMRHGIVTDWHDMTNIWRHAYHELNVVQEEVWQSDRSFLGVSQSSDGL